MNGAVKETMRSSSLLLMALPVVLVCSCATPTTPSVELKKFRIQMETSDCGITFRISGRSRA